MQTVLYFCPNPECGQKHALTRLNRKSGYQLGVICGYDTAKPPKFVALPQSLVDCIDESDLGGIPVYSTPEARKKTENAGNLQFVLMNTQPGEAVERGVTLDRPNSDARQAQDLQTRIEQLRQAQTEISRQIESLALKRIKLENDERETRKKLREYATEPLKLERYD